MLKRRVASIEKRIAGLGGTAAKKPRLIYSFGDGTDSSGEKDEARDEENGLIVFRMSRPRLPEGERVLRFDFGSGEGRTRQAIPKTMDTMSDSNQPSEGEKK
jgi:hypothetical protein